jgi:hypothetical protein
LRPAALRVDLPRAAPLAAERPVLRAFLRRAGAPRWPLVTERIIDATAASAAAIAAAVAARVAIFSIREAVFLARPTTLL